MLNHPVGHRIGMEGEEVSIVVDVRSEEEQNRTVHILYDKMQSPVFFYGLPSSVKMGVFFRCIGSVEFVSFEEVVWGMGEGLDMTSEGRRCEEEGED